MKLNKKVIFLCFFLTLWVAIIFFLSAQDGTETANLSLTIATIIVDFFFVKAPAHLIYTVHDFIRTIAHLFLFAVLGALLAFASRLTFNNKASFAISSIISFTIGFIDEWKKQFVNGRHFDTGEVLLNMLSSFISILLVLAIINKIDSKQDAT